MIFMEKASTSAQKRAENVVVDIDMTRSCVELATPVSE
jgi:hypothetical protein